MRARCKIESPAYTQYIVTHADAFLRIRYASHKFYALMNDVWCAYSAHLGGGAT
jgi:hypothetical protein